MKIQVEGKQVWVNYHHLYCFYLIAQSGGIAPASEVLKIGSSALSIQMKQFEEQLGFTLFERSHRKLIPNERGKVMLHYASEIFRLGTEMVKALQDRKSEVRTQVKIGALDSIPKHLPVQLVEEALQKMKCTISLVEGKQDQLLTDLMEHRIDLMLSNGIPQIEAGRLYYKRIARMKLCVVGASKFRKFTEGFPHSIHDQSMVMPTSQSRVRQEFDNFLSELEVRPEIVAESQDVMVQKLMALRGLGMTVVPEYAVREFIDSKELFSIGTLDGRYEEVYLLSVDRRIHNPVAQYLMKEFRVR